jgi:hypothetical protein
MAGPSSYRGFRTNYTMVKTTQGIFGSYCSFSPQWQSAAPLSALSQSMGLVRRFKMLKPSHKGGPP